MASAPHPPRYCKIVHSIKQELRSADLEGLDGSQVIAPYRLRYLPLIETALSVIKRTASG